MRKIRGYYLITFLKISAFNTPAYPPAFQTPDVTGTITQEHLKASLLSAVEDKIRRALREEYESKMVLFETSINIYSFSVPKVEPFVVYR